MVKFLQVYFCTMLSRLTCLLYLSKIYMIDKNHASLSFVVF